MVAKCTVAKRVEVSGRRLLFSVKETLQNGHKMEQAVAGGYESHLQTEIHCTLPGCYKSVD